VLCQSFRNPALLAKMAATLQFLSGGRFILGLGAGWHAEEYRAYGYDFPAPGVRVEQLEETLQIIRALWTEAPATFAGKHYHIADAYCEPRPDPLPPVMIGAFRPKMLRLTARYADWWNASSTPVDAYRRMSAALDRACAEIGRDPATLRRTWGGGCVCAPTEAQARAWAGDRYVSEDPEEFDFVGTPAQIVDQMRPFIEAGVTYFMLDCGGWPETTTLELLVREVMPEVTKDE
jgi:alkanesulfonate monooxygenase SsuD/methylene tetrahydromethanopterin reductase-like flavin-dependent oxidoreductase (luciferase family)